MKKNENTKYKNEDKKKEEPSEETNKAAEDVISAAEPPLPNVESKAAKAGEKEPAKVSVDSRICSISISNIFGTNPPSCRTYHLHRHPAGVSIKKIPCQHEICLNSSRAI